MSATIQLQQTVRKVWVFGCRISGEVLTEHKLTAPDAETAVELHDEAFPNHEFVACVIYVPKQHRNRTPRCARPS